MLGVLCALVLAGAGATPAAAAPAHAGLPGAPGHAGQSGPPSHAERGRADVTEALHVDGDTLRDVAGDRVVLRGVNHPHAWYPEELDAVDDIAAAGANSVRVVLSAGVHGHDWRRTSPEEVEQIIERTRDAGLVAVLEIHDTTGWPDDAAAAPMDEAVDYWLDIAEVLRGHEDQVMINIANEPIGNERRDEHAAHTTEAITRLRDGGLDHVLVADAPAWGQDWGGEMRQSAPEIAAADPQGDVVFSVHMYGVYEEAATVAEYFDAFADHELPLIVGEFGHDHSDGNPDEDAILAETAERGLGWLAWSWSGNGGGVEYLDLVEDFDADEPTAWGERIISGAGGLRETSEDVTFAD